MVKVAWPLVSVAVPNGGVVAALGLYEADPFQVPPATSFAPAPPAYGSPDGYHLLAQAQGDAAHPGVSLQRDLAPGTYYVAVSGAGNLDFNPLLANSHYSGSDPIADGYVKLIDDGHGDTWLYFDTDGRGTADQWGTFVATVQHVAPSSITVSDLILH